MSEENKTLNFLEQIIQKDIDEGRCQKLVTRFPPEPNGYLHIGHAKSICLNFGLAETFGGVCNLRFDDTNPAKEDAEFVDAIKQDVEWLGFKWNDDVRYASSYFQTFYEWAIHLIQTGKAYVCDLTPEEASEYRGWATKPGKESPYRSRSVDENIQLLEKMKQGDFEEGQCVLRAKIDMASPNMQMRDPILYRIRKAHHHQTGNDWCIYPTYDFAHGQEDAIEGVTHSICTLEFADHRPLYEWFLANLPVPSTPKQYEFARLELNYTVTSKRKLKQLVDEKHVDAWDDPRMPTISGLRRRGVTPQALRKFCDIIGVTKSGSTIDVSTLEYAVRDDLNNSAARAMCVIDPVKVTLTNFNDVFSAAEVTVNQPVHPNNDALGTRKIPFTEFIYIDRADFSEDTSLSRKKFKRLVTGDYVRLRGASVIQAHSVVRDENDSIVEIKALVVADTIGKNPEGIKARGVIHWVSATNNIPCEVRQYDRLFTDETPDGHETPFTDFINPNSMVIKQGCFVELSVLENNTDTRYQFEHVYKRKEDLIKFGIRVKDIDRQYEQNNN